MSDPYKLLAQAELLVDRLKEIDEEVFQSGHLMTYEEWGDSIMRIVRILERAIARRNRRRRHAQH